MRSHRTLVDRPEAKGGADRGPMGGELLLAALGGCFATTADADAFGRLVVVAERGCIVANTIRGPVSLRVEAVARAPVT